MSYTALYRKYRPAYFSEVRGQDAIVTTLRNQIRADRIGHAYLFSGTRGTGKTTIAKIMARAVNCEAPVDGEPCGECPMCRSILAGTSLNVIEIDAASNNGVDNIRAILDEVEYPPSEGRYKVYIIDEVHMLSAGAYNALLKTLEEPPHYVIFILATTEVHKIPVTILSRCQRYSFKRIGTAEICSRLTALLTEEHVEAEEDAVKYIARKADGAMRDALSLADQCISFYLGQKLTYEKVLGVLGAVDTDVISSLLRMLINSDVGGALTKLSDLASEGLDLDVLVSDFTEYLRSILLYKASEVSAQMLDLSPEQLTVLEEDAASVRDDTLMRYIHAFSELAGQMRYAYNKRVLLEIAVIRLCRPQMRSDELSVLHRVRRLEEIAEKGMMSAAAGQGTGFAGYAGYGISSPAGYGMSAGQNNPAGYGMSAGQNNPAGSGMSAGQNNPAGSGMSAGQNNPAGSGMSAGQNNPAGSGMSAGQNNPAGYGMNPGQNNPAGPGMFPGQSAAAGQVSAGPNGIVQNMAGWNAAGQMSAGPNGTVQNMAGRDQAGGMMPGENGSGISGKSLYEQKAAPGDLQQIEAMWPGIIAGTSSPRFGRVLAETVRMFDASDPDTNLLVVAFNNFLGEPYIGSAEHTEELERLIGEKLGKEIRVKLIQRADAGLYNAQLMPVEIKNRDLAQHIAMDIETEDD